MPFGFEMVYVCLLSGNTVHNVAVFDSKRRKILLDSLKLGYFVGHSNFSARDVIYKTTKTV